MTAPLGIRMRFGDWWVIVTPGEGERYTIDVMDVESRQPRDRVHRKQACREMTKVLNKLRKQIFVEELDGEKDGLEADD